MEFGVGKVQMKFLHLLSNEASHRITLHCLNNPLYSPADGFSSTGPVHKEDATLQFHGWNKHTFEKDTLFEPHVLQDDCKVMDRIVILSPLSFIFNNKMLDFQAQYVYYVKQGYKWLFFSLILHLSDPRWQLAPVTFLLPYSGQLSATYCRHTGIPHAAQQSATYRSQSSLLPLTPTSMFCNLLHKLLKCKAVYKWLPPKEKLEHQALSVRGSLMCLLESVNGTLIKSTPTWKNCFCGTSRPRTPKENSVYQYLSNISCLIFLFKWCLGWLHMDP